MKTNVSISGRCRYSDRVELLCLGEKLSEEDERQVRLHLEDCPSCKRAFRRLERFYDVLDRQVNKPIHNKALDLAKRASAHDVEYGLVICEPMEREPSGEQASYKSKVVFCANGHVVGEHDRLADYRLQDLPKDQIAIRAMSDRAQNKLLLYLWSPGDQHYDGWQLQIAGETEKAQFGPAGTAAIALREIEELGDKVIYFEEKHSDWAPEIDLTR